MQLKNNMASVADFQGAHYLPETARYTRANECYAASSYGEERDMNPGEIFQPSCVEDIQVIVRYATSIGKTIAIRTGGHQYSGASTAQPGGIQLDLKHTFRRPQVDLRLFRGEEDGKMYMRTSVSWELGEMWEFLSDNGVFMPTGYCAKVCLGGHVQTGGYGMLARSFGLLGDYVRELETVDHEGNVVKITKESDPGMFFAYLGGSPGNLGVLTHVTIEVQEDVKHQGSKGLWMAFHYKQETYKELLEILAARAADPNFPRNYDMCVNVISRQANLLDLFPGSEAELKKKLPGTALDDKVADLLKFKYALIVVYAQWTNFGEDNKEDYDDRLFQDIKNVEGGFTFMKEAPEGTPVSKIFQMWMMNRAREFDHPYVKRVNVTNSTSLLKTDWADWFSGRVDEVLSVQGNGLWVASQIQLFGGRESKFANGAGNGRAYSWRDSTVVANYDVFFQDDKEGAEDWQRKNDEGAKEHFCEEDRRMLWGSFGDWNMKEVWPRYFDEETYRKVQKIRARADPNGVFTANPFCVEAAP